MGKLVGIMDAVVSKRNRNKIPRGKAIGQEGVAVVIEEAVGEVPQGGRRERQQLLRALARMLHIPMRSTLRSLPQDLASTGPTRTSSGEGYRFVLLSWPFFQVADMHGGESFSVVEKLVKLGVFVAYRQIYLCIALGIK
jgi:hypothetical protein